MRRKIGLFLPLVLCLAMLMVPVTPIGAAAPSEVKIQDNELVVIGLNGDSTMKNISVLDHLRMTGQGPAAVADPTAFDLASTRDLYSSEKPVVKDGKVLLNTNVNGTKDIYYLATLSSKARENVQLPVKINVEYYLNGKQMTPQEIAGKSGHLKIVTTVENLTGQPVSLEYTKDGKKLTYNTTIYTPYVVAMNGWKFPNKMFQNVQAPGVSGKSPQGVVVDVQGTTQVSWSVPLVPPVYPAKQYTVVEADGTNINLGSFDIAVIPILPVTSEIDTKPQIKESLEKLHGGFGSIAQGVGSAEQANTLLNGFSQVNSGVGKLNEGLETVYKNLVKIRYGLSNDAFNPATYDMAKGTDAHGNSPGVKEALMLSKSSIDSKLIPALDAQNLVLNATKVALGTKEDTGQTPALTTSIYNDLNTLKAKIGNDPDKLAPITMMEIKLTAINSNLTTLQKGGKMTTPTGQIDFPASTDAIKAGVTALSSALGKTAAGVDMITTGLGKVKANGKPVPVMTNGNPGTLLYALSYMNDGVSKLIPGLGKMEGGVSQIGSGASQAQAAIEAGMVPFDSADALIQALNKKAAEADTFLGKPEGATGSVTYVFQTTPIQTSSAQMAGGLIALVVLVVLVAVLGRKPKMPSVPPSAPAA